MIAVMGRDKVWRSHIGLWAPWNTWRNTLTLRRRGGDRCGLPFCVNFVSVTGLFRRFGHVCPGPGAPHAALVTGASAGLTEPRAGRRDAYHFAAESSPMSKMPRPNMPAVPSSVTAGTAPDAYPTAC